MDVSSSQPKGPLRARNISVRKPQLGVEEKQSSTIKPRATHLASGGPARNRIPLKPDPDRPKSPRDTTPLVLDGEPLDQTEIPPIPLLPEVSNPPEETVEPNITPISPQVRRHRTTLPSSPQHVPSSPGKELPSPQHVPSSSGKELPSPQQASSPRKEEPSSPQQASLPRKEESSPPKKHPNKKQAVKRPRQVTSRKLLPPDFARMSQVDRQAALATYRKRFSNLRDAFPGLGVEVIPDPYEASPENLLILHVRYDEYMTHVLVSEDVSQNMIILLFVLAGVELFLTKVLGLPASKYVVNQFKLIAKYRSLLYELGEEKIANSGKASPPMVRLIYLILLTAITTVGIRLFESTIGSTAASMAQDVVYGILGGGGADAPTGDPTQNIGGFDLNGILKFAGNFLGNNNVASVKTEAQGPVYNE